MRTVLKWLGFALGAVVLVLVAVLGWASLKFSAKAHSTTTYPLAGFSRHIKGSAARGRYLVTVRMTCVECHGQDLAGGTVIDDPVAGHVHGSNITPFKLKAWSDAEIIRTLRHGVSRDGHPLVIMPSEDYQAMSEPDMADIVAYLRSVPAVERPDLPNSAGPLLKVFWALGKTPQVFGTDMIDHQRPFAPVVKAGVTPAYGKYIFLNTCVGCHRENLQGGPMPGTPPDWAVPANITQDALGSWSEADFIKTLKTGVNPSGAKLRLPMAMILKYTPKFSATELKALWAYIRTVQGTPIKGKTDF